MEGGTEALGPPEVGHRRMRPKPEASSPRSLDEALGKGRPEVFNTDQGVQFTAEAFTRRLESAGVAVSMDGRGRALDNVFVERLWRTVKYEAIYIPAYE